MSTKKKSSQQHHALFSHYHALYKDQRLSKEFRRKAALKCLLLDGPEAHLQALKLAADSFLQLLEGSTLFPEFVPHWETVGESSGQVRETLAQMSSYSANKKTRSRKAGLGKAKKGGIRE
jgi:hypothetical protein